MALPLSPALRSGTRASRTLRRAPAHLSALTWPAALAALACCGLAACSATGAPGAGTTRTVTAQPGSRSATPTGGSTPRTARQAGAGPGACLASQLKGSLGAAQGAAGTLYQTVLLTNTSAAACTLYGYPGVSFVTTAGGSQVGAPANRDATWPQRLVTLAPGSLANFQVALTDVGVYPASQCNPAAVNWLRVYPPGDYDSLYVSYSAQTCALTTKVVMRVSSVQEGAAGPGA
jgi:Domain of unknown function (DUF4232)